MPRSQRLNEAAPARAHAPAPIRADPNPGLLSFSLHLAYDGLWLAAGVLGAPIFALRSALRPGFARMLRERLGGGLGAVQPAAGARILVHAVSVGEVKGAVPIVRALEAAYPGCELALCTTTDTGLAVARSLFPGQLVLRFPADLTPIMRRFLRRLAPTCVVLIELEVWPNFLRESNRAGIPVAVANGRITDRSFGRYRFFRSFFPQFNRISMFCVQGEDYAARFLELLVPAERVRVTGNVKADGLRLGVRERDAELVRLVAARADQLVLVAGSTHAPEERYVLAAAARALPGARVVLVPRHPERGASLVAELAAAGARCQLLSELRSGRAAPDPNAALIVNTIGELERVYALADLVFVGGSLVPHGGQNVLEPAAQGKAVVVGPSVENFAPETALLRRAGACVQLARVEELAQTLARLGADANLRARMGAAGIAAVSTQRGATQRTLDALAETVLPASLAAAAPRPVTDPN